MKEIKKVQIANISLQNAKKKELIIDEKVKIIFSFNDNIILINITQKKPMLKEYEALLSLQNYMA